METTISKNKLIIFDIDGTLSDSVFIHQQAFQKALDSFGFNAYDTNWSNYLHHTDTFIFKTILESQLKREVLLEDIDRFEDILHKNIQILTEEKEIQEIKGANHLLKTLKDYGYDYVFATGSLLKPALLKLKQCGIECNAHLLVTANSLFSREEIVLEAINKAKQYYSTNSYEEIISFGDGLWDYKTAKKLSLGFIGIANEKLKDHGVDLFFLTLSDHSLLSHLGIAQPMVPDFMILAEGEISNEFRKRNITNFKAATEWVTHLPYGRNKNKNNLVSVFSDNQGTCSTKHALLKKLAIENNFEDIELVIGLFKMNKVNTPEVAKTLDKHCISYIPEAHNYLKYKGKILDFTKPNFLPSDFVNDLIEEVKIMPDQITGYKVEYHRKFLADWLQKESIHMSLDDLWNIREQCIADLVE